MTPFAAPVDDILHSLDLAGAARLPDWDAELVREVVGHFAAFAAAEIAPLDERGDREGCRLEGGRVVMPPGFAAAYRAYAEGGWPGLAASEAHGGQGMPGPVLGAVSEIFAGACHALQMVTGLVPGAVRTLMEFGTEDQQARLVPPLASGEWLSTMCLTEPGAGSDLAATRTRATEEGGIWRITGEKIFISGGDQDMSEEILHLVLARTGGAEEGVRGLSLFVCRSHRDDGSRNAVTVTRIEEKMGLHASPTCQLAFDGAKAELVGEAGAGLKAMFTMMNHARLDVALQGVAHAARASQIARAYAAERRQGRGPDGAPVTIDRHPGVAAMLEEQEALAIGGRALCHAALVALEAGDEPELVEFLTPVCKAFCTEGGIRAADLGIQVLGGYGYLGEYRVEQTYRDARITSIYEGTNGIHALTLAGRLLRLNGGAAADAFERFVAAQAGGDAAAGRSLARWREARAAVLRADPAEAAPAFMELTGLVAWQAAWAALERTGAQSPDPARTERLARFVRRAAPTAMLRPLALLGLEREALPGAA
jgi:3-(methylthio)propanoyl-CoA dehydrogenase